MGKLFVLCFFLFAGPVMMVRVVEVDRGAGHVGIKGVEAPQSQPMLDHLLGAWAGEGELFGQPTRFGMRWETELLGHFLELTYEIDGPVQMIARAHYRIDRDSIEGVWVDSRGEILQIGASVTDSTLETIWRSPTEMGRTVYRRLGPDSLIARDFVRDGEGWRPFGIARYGRR